MIDHRVVLLVTISQFEDGRLFSWVCLDDDRLKMSLSSRDSIDTSD